MIDWATLASKRQKKRSDYAVYRTSEGGDKPKYYALDMFPYPSGAGLHVGHPKGYIATDVVSRQKKLAGYNVLHPMGFDSFGLPTENYAMKNKIHPSVATDQNISVFIDQLKKIGFNYDRDRMVSTADPEFYKRTQWMFIQLYEHRYDSEAEKARPISELKSILRMRDGENPVASDGAGERVKYKPMKYLIFDFDGVLADTFPDAGKIQVLLGNAQSEEEGKEKSIQYSSNKPDHTKDHTLTDDEMLAKKTFIKGWSDHQINLGFSLFDAFVDEIQKLQDTRIAIVTSNSVDIVHHKKDAFAFTPTHILGIEDHHSKEEKIEQICRDRGCDVSEVYYFTDTKADVYELQDMITPGKIIGCGRGFCGYDALCEVLPRECVMRDFHEIHDVISRQGDPRSSAGQDSKTVRQGGSLIPVWTLHKSHYQRDEVKIAKLLAEHSHSEDGYIDVTCAYIRLADGRIVLQHLPKHNIFILPGGKVDKGETVEQAFIRECQEEVGITPTAYTLFGVCKVIHKGAPRRLWYYDVTGYDGEVTNLEPSKHNLQYARIEPSDNRRGMQIVLENTVVSDADELNNSFRDVILCEKDFRDPRYKIEEWIDAPVMIESQDGEYITLWMDMATKQYVVRGQQEVTNGSKQHEVKNSPEIAAYNSRCRKQSLSPSGDKSDKENFHTLTDEEKIDRYIDTEKRLAFISHAPINWCPSCMTALANEDLDGNACERCGTTIERRKMRQWMIRITDYAQRLLDGLDLLPERQDNIKAMQRHWIGRSEGTTFTFQVAKHSLSFDVYTTRIDTVYGVTFVSLAPEHSLVEQITTAAQRDAVMAYVEESKNKTDIQRQEAKEKTGVRTGSYAINPFTNEQIPIRVADYVLMDYGTGAVMAVPAHDERDWEFAKKFGLEKKQVIGPIVGILHDDSYAKDSVYGLIYNNDKTKVLVLGKGMDVLEVIYNMPGGTIEEGETLESALRREIQEETGLQQFEIEGQPIFLQAHYFVDKKEGREKFGRCNNSHVFTCIASTEELGALQLTEDEKHGATPPERIAVEEFESYIQRLGDDSGNKIAYQMLTQKKAMTDKGVLVNSGPFTGMTSEEAIPAMQARLDEKGIGKKKINYRIQDRVFSRQRYRGEPIPMLYVPKRKVHELRFRDAKRRNALGVTKTIETRAGNPDESERFFGHIAVGDIIAAKFVETGEYKHFLVTKTYYWKQIRDLRDAGEETMQRIYSSGKAPVSLEQLVSDFEATSPDYADRLHQHGLYGFAIEKYDIATDISSNNYQIRPMSSDELPLTLPDVAHYEPTGTEEGPLAKISEWIDQVLPDGTPARRESNTMPGRAGSSWYWIRYMDPRNANAVVSPEVEAYRGQVDLYVGGMEHACRHLIYARFRHKFLKDIGVVTTEEPFKRLKGVGLVLAEDGRKMSKRRGNVINPDDVIAEFGTDAFRSYEMFMGPFDSEVARSTAGVKGVKRFLDKVVKISEKVK